MIRLNFVVVLFLAALPLRPSVSHAQIIPSEAFIRYIDDAGLTFRESLLSAYKMAPIIENEHMNYELAVTLEKPRLEIRYSIRNYELTSQDSLARVDPVEEAKGMFVATALNVARREADIVDMNEFDPVAVKSEFNADWGATAKLVPKKEFSSKFDTCVLVIISKGRAAAFMFYLFNENTRREVISEMQNVFYALRFR